MDVNDLPSGAKVGDRVVISNIDEVVVGRKITRSEDAIVIDPTAKYDFPTSKPNSPNPDADSFHVLDEAERLMRENPNMSGQAVKFEEGLMSKGASGRQYRRLKRVREKIRKLEIKKRDIGLNNLENQELAKLRKEIEPKTANHLDAVDELKGTDGRTLLVEPHVKLNPEVAIDVNYAQNLLNDLNRPNAIKKAMAGAEDAIGDGSSALATIAEQIKGGVKPAEIIRGFKHGVKSEEYLTPLVNISRKLERMANCPKSVIRRLALEIKKTQEAVEWAQKYGAASASGRKAPIRDLPEWAVGYLDELKKHL